MKKLFDYSNKYVQQSTWKDLALIKICLCSIGILMGLAIPKKASKPVAVGATSMFIASYIPLMMKLIRIIEGDSPQKQV